MTKADLIQAVRALHQEDPRASHRIATAGRAALTNWPNAPYGAREAALEVAMEVQLLVEVHAIAWKKKDQNRDNLPRFA